MIVIGAGEHFGHVGGANCVRNSVSDESGAGECDGDALWRVARSVSGDSSGVRRRVHAAERGAHHVLLLHAVANFRLAGLYTPLLCCHHRNLCAECCGNSGNRHDHWLRRLLQEEESKTLKMNTHLS